MQSFFIDISFIVTYICNSQLKLIDKGGVKNETNRHYNPVYWLFYGNYA